MKIADLKDDSPTYRDAAATWILGHQERISTGRPYVRGDDLMVDAVIHVPCKYLEPTPGVGTNGNEPGVAAPVRCGVHRFRGRMRPVGPPSRNGQLPFRRGEEKTIVFYKGRQRALTLPLKRAAKRALPVMQDANPCVGAPCRTADNKHGAACCRDLSLDLAIPEPNERMELLLRARKSPYLCKVKRTDADTVECEVISACGYLELDGITCALHDRLLPNGRLAKPSICMEWPDLGPDDTGHPGCALL